MPSWSPPPTSTRPAPSFRRTVGPRSSRGPIRRGGTIIEDDYDAEFRYDREPIGAIQGLAPDRVVYAGSASKILAPGLRLGWLVAPPALVEAIVAAKQASDMGSAALDQLAFADVLARGELDRHLRRMRPIYRGRRDALLEALGRHLPDLEPVGASAGLHLLAWLPPGSDDGAIVAAAGRSGIGARWDDGPPDRTRPGGADLRLRRDRGGCDRRGDPAAGRGHGSGRDGGAGPAAAWETAAVNEPPIDLAVYGTLRRGEQNEVFLADATYLGVGAVLGRLHEMPRSGLRAYAYPALDLDGPDRIVVELYRLPDAAALATIDGLEAYDPTDEAASQYVRRSVPVVDGPVATAWTYVYNGPRHEVGEAIGSGDWVEHRERATG